MADPPRRRPDRDRPGAATQKTNPDRERPAPEVRDEVLRRQAGLAERVASFLRDQPTRNRVGLAAGALLIAAAGGAVAYNAVTPDAPVETLELAAAQPLTHEVREGLPTAPGRYTLYADSVQRDQRGIYHFDWQDTSTSPATRRQASASLMRLAGGDEDLVEVPAGGGDPILYLRSDTPIAVVAETAESASAAGGGNGSGDGGRTFLYMGGWYPFYGGFTRTPAYMSPSVSSISPGGRVDGSVVSASPPPPASRTMQVPARADAVSGQARGVGGGTAATSRLGGTGGGRTTLAPARSGGFTSGVGSVGGGASA